MKLGIVGLPNVGKSTLFNAITKAGAQSANYPFCTIEPNVGVVTVPDERLEVLEKIYNSKRKVYTSIEFYDIAGLVRGASNGEGLGNKFLSHIREVESVIHVVRCFEDDNVVHVDGGVDPLRDIETINLELILSDVEIIDRRLDKIRKMAKNDKSYQEELEIIEKVKNYLDQGHTARSLELSEKEQETIETLNLLTNKPVIYAANVSEDDILSGHENDLVKIVKDFALKEKSTVIPICAKLEEDISSYDEEEKKAFLDDLGIKETGLDKLIKASYYLLNLISFLTAGEQEVRAWTIINGTKAPKAASKIHSDIERGFIRAETIHYNDLVSAGNIVQAKEKGLVRLEGKEYVVKDGDIILFRFNV
jgi:GTP-binding protein YchF